MTSTVNCREKEANSYSMLLEGSGYDVPYYKPQLIYGWFTILWKYNTENRSQQDQWNNLSLVDSDKLEFTRFKKLLWWRFYIIISYVQQQPITWPTVQFTQGLQQLGIGPKKGRFRNFKGYWKDPQYKPILMFKNWVGHQKMVVI